MIQALELQTESPELLTALSSLSTFYTENTPVARRQLRSTLEQRSLQVNQEYLTAAEGVLQVRSFSSVGSHLQASSAIHACIWNQLYCLLHLTRAIS